MSKATMEVYVNDKLQRVYGGNITYVPCELKHMLKDIEMNSEWCRDVESFKFVFKVKRRKRSHNRFTVIVRKRPNDYPYISKFDVSMEYHTLTRKVDEEIAKYKAGTLNRV